MIYLYSIIEGLFFTDFFSHSQSDYAKYDYIIGMDSYNLRNMKRMLPNDTENKIHLLLDWSDNPRDIADPWYTGDFDVTYNDVLEGCIALLKEIKKEL